MINRMMYPAGCFSLRFFGTNDEIKRPRNDKNNANTGEVRIIRLKHDPVRKSENDRQADNRSQQENGKQVMEAQRDFALDHLNTDLRHVNKLCQRDYTDNKAHDFRVDISNQ